MHQVSIKPPVRMLVGLLVAVVAGVLGVGAGSGPAWSSPAGTTTLSAHRQFPQSVQSLNSPTEVTPQAVGTCALVGGDAHWKPLAGVWSWVVDFGTWRKGDYCAAGKARLVLQDDGNFVLYDENDHARWAANTYGRGQRATMQGFDGNLVVYNGENQALWASNTCCHDNWFLAVQSDGNVVIYDGNTIPQWATNTAH